MRLYVLDNVYYVHGLFMDQEANVKYSSHYLSHGIIASCQINI